jgi:Na+-translocating ferredoxin:NAD+ oxidoreductase RnfC subunit
MLGHGIFPHQIMRAVNYGLDVPEEVIRSAFLCSECGLCEVYGCTMGVSPAAVNGILKERLRESGYYANFEPRELSVHQMREYRKVPSDRLLQRLMLSRYAGQVTVRGEENSPGMVEIPLRQHIGKPAGTVVREGETVLCGQTVGRMTGAETGAEVHASISGTVVRADEERIVISAGSSDR